MDDVPDRRGLRRLVFLLDEPPALPTWTPTIPDAFAPSIPEDFAGSLPLEEPPGWLWVSLETPWITVPIGEDFAG